MTLDEWKQSKAPRGEWRLRARRAILEAVNGAPPGADLLKVVDAAYPFGMRKYQPYKDWLTERKLFRAALNGPPEMPTEDEVGVCEVARDLVEVAGPTPSRDDLIRIYALLEQAPKRLARPCPACGVAPGLNCHEGIRTLLVPHHARLIGRLGNGPLFGGPQ